MCADCWEAEHGSRAAAYVADADLEQCCMCGMTTRSGIYERIYPALVPFPATDKEA
jgi:hypothetical protein